MATGKIKATFPGSTSGSQNISTGLPGITTSNTTTEDLLAQTTQELTQNLTDVNSGLNNLIASQQQQSEATQENTQALEASTQSRSGGATGAVESAASSLLGGGGLLSPLISGIMSLFGGSSSQSDTVFQPFSLPPPIAVQATISGGAANQSTATQGNGAGAGSTAVTVQVNAIDSQSFLDHQDDIAEAVRQAMLQSHPINDVIAQL